MSSMDDILSDKEPEKPAVETPETPSEPAVEKPTSIRKEWRGREYDAQGRDPETGKFVSKEEPKVEPEKPKEPEKPAPPKQEMSDKEKAFLRTAEEERRKRQTLEARLAELEKKLTEKTQEPPKPFWDDPEGSVGALKKEIEAAKQEARQEALKSHLRTTEALARSKYTDFDEKLQRFGEMLQTTPGLHAQWLNAVDPAEFAYKAAKNSQVLEEAGGLDELRMRMRQEIRAEVEKELAEKEAKIRAERAKLPQSLTDTRSVAPANKPVWGGPTPMSDILGRG